MNQITPETITWVDPEVIPDSAHVLHHAGMWCIVNVEGKVAVYQMGTGDMDANALQGNRNKMIAERFLPRYKDVGAVGVQFFEHIFLPDSPGRYDQ